MINKAPRVLCLLICLVGSADFSLAQSQDLKPAQTSSEKPAYLKRPVSNAAERQALLQLCAQFQQALREKNGKLLASLLLHDQILFNSPANPEFSDLIKAKHNPHFNGLAPNGALDFMRFITTHKGTVEEKFYDIQINQDKHLAWVNFDFEFIENGKVVNYGQEHWQVLKTSSGEWKIFSVVWSSYGEAPVEPASR